MHDCQPQACAAPFAGKIRHEQLVLLLRLDPHAFVGHAHNDPMPFEIILRAHPETALLVHRLDGVVEQVDQHAVHLCSVEVQRRQRLIQLDHELDISVRPPIEHHHFLDHVLERPARHLWRRHPRKLGKLIKHPLQAVHLVDDHAG